MGRGIVSGKAVGKRSVTREIPVLCRFWWEDSVWNASAHDLPVAVYGQTIEEARKNLGDGLICYFESLLKLERLDAVAEKLERLAQERLLPMTEMPADEFFLKTMTMLSDHKVTTHELRK